MRPTGSLITVFLAVLIDLIGFGIILPLLPFYAASFNASALTIGFLYSIFSIAQLTFSPIWGSLSDRIGRRPVMLISTFGASIAYVIFAFSNSLGWLFFSRLIAGVMGGNISAAQAYVADVTTHKDRAKGMGMIGAAFGIGFAVGPAISTLLIHEKFLDFFHIADRFKFAIPGLFAAILSLLSFLFVLFQLPESVKTGGQDPKKIVRASIFSKQFWISLAQEQKAAKSLFAMLMVSVFVLAFSQASLYSAFPIFCKFELGLDAHEVGMLFVYMGLIVVLVQGGLLRIVVRKFGEEKLFFAGCIMMFVGFILIPFASNKHYLALTLCLMSFGGSLNGPTLNSLISQEADPSQMGAVLGTAQGISGLGRAIGPAWGGFLYDINHRFPFIATALLLIITIRAGFRLVALRRNHHRLNPIAASMSSLDE